MFLQQIVYLLLSILSVTHGRTTIRVGLFDDLDQTNVPIDILVPNVTVCDQRDLHVHLYWIHSSNSLLDLLDQLESEESLSDVYLTRTGQRRTALIEAFCHTHNLPFIDLKSFASETGLCPLMTSSAKDYFHMPNILRVLINYLKYHRVRKAVYIYDHDDAAHRLFDLLQWMNSDDYFNDFSLEIRTTHDDVYALLYSIETNSFSKEQSTRYIILDLHFHDEYERMFDRISHMGLTSDSYYYIILSTLDACSWMQRVNFTGRLIYFDYQPHSCEYDSPSSSMTMDRLSPANEFEHHSSYYRSRLSFRSRHDAHSSPTSLAPNSSTVSNSANHSSNSCTRENHRNANYFSFDYLNSKLSKSSQSYARALYDSLNLLVRVMASDLIDCRAYRLKKSSKKSFPCQYANVYIFSTRKFSSNQFKKQIELIGRYSTSKNQYQSCQVDEREDAANAQKLPSSRVYYITSLFDEPFLMLRRQANAPARHDEGQVSLRSLGGHAFDFGELEGYCVDLAEKICSILNITCQFRIVQDGNFGSKNASTGVWNGMVGEIVSRQADMAIAPLTISQKRMEVVDFSKPFMNLGISIMIRKPDVEKPGVFSFMNPVSMEIWLCFSLAYVAVSVVLFLTSRVVNSGWRRRIVRRPSYRSFSYPKSVNDRRKSEIELHRQRGDSNLSEQSIPTSLPAKNSMRRRYHYRTRPPLQNQFDSKLDKKKKDKQSDKSKDSAVHLFGISNALFFSFASFMRQSINLVPKSLSGRVAATSWWYFSLIFISSYTANLVAFLTVEKLVTPIENVEDLAKQQEIKYGSVRNGTTSAFFEKSNVSVFQHMWVIMQKSSSEVIVATNDDGVRKVRNSKGRYAFFIESTKNEYVNERLPCDTMKVGFDLDSKGYGIATRLGSDLTEAINIIVTNLRESGFLDKLKQRWWYERSECSQTAKDKRFSELSLSSVTGLFYIFLFGIILSCFIAFTEFLITSKAESKRLDISFQEMLRIKMIENMIGITIHAQRQLEFDRLENEFNHLNHHEPVEPIPPRMHPSQSDV